jgi:hypothetical protein
MLSERLSPRTPDMENRPPEVPWRVGEDGVKLELTCSVVVPVTLWVGDWSVGNATRREGFDEEDGVIRSAGGGGAFRTGEISGVGLGPDLDGSRADIRIPEEAVRAGVGAAEGVAEGGRGTSCAAKAP